MAKFEHALTPINLAKLGVYDEFYELYTAIAKIYNDYLVIADANKRLGVWRNKELIKEARKLINAFLENYTYIFSNDYKWLHPNVLSMNWLQIVDMKKVKPLHLMLEIVSFRVFLRQLQDSISIIIWNRIRYEKPKIAQEYVFEMVNKHILLLVKEAEKKICCPNDKNLSETKQLIVFKNLTTISCKRNSHNVVCDRMEVLLIDKDETVMLPIHKCLDCNKRFIGNETLRIYEKAYGRLYLVLRKDEDTEGLIFNFLSESKLHRAGYNVEEGKLTKQERQELLVKLIETKRLTYFEICNDIEKAISIHKNNPKFINAISKWSSDLLFISEYIKKR